ncbi:PREDICTED: protein DA1-like isoform X1 [Lupinus angustifolius]|uniref:protein DA1-like isoform X1 n=1 Tax=Lupinus angustifolius TaxID=3871 RepID=UPI00092F951A|nr:PREDICTED: protein DA1-like isoform X1 [Lupinus angustifolius]XP_019415309.1 PREDICTED: protein DA1-like isoform X1 [Lupinus angustifolius]
MLTKKVISLFILSNNFLNRICAGCNSVICESRKIDSLNGYWHINCFRCRACNQPIDGSREQFASCGRYPYHKSCYRPKCDVCKNIVPSNPLGSLTNPFWKQESCPSHAHDGTPRCTCCFRFQPRGTKGYIDLHDANRKLCPECMDSAIMVTNKCQPLYAEIHQFYEGLHMPVNKRVPLLLVENEQLYAMVSNKSLDIKGVCVRYMESTINIVTKQHTTPEKRTRPFKLTLDNGIVSGILILFGLPRILTGFMIAHEMMHAWMNLSGYEPMSEEVEEGISQVMGHMWLECELSSSSSRNGRWSNYERKLGEFCKYQVEVSPCPIYGNGFRKAHQAVQKFGLKKTLQHMRRTGNFPF